MPELNPFLSMFANVPALVEPQRQEQMNALLGSIDLSTVEAAARADQDGFWPAVGTYLSVFRPYNVSAGILQIPVKGALLNSFPYAYPDGRATGYEYISKALDRGLADPEVKGIALVINSPGGMVAGNFDLADKIFAARSVKPIQAFVNEDAYSAAYSLASSADKITVARTGGTGSIGVVTAHMDMSKLADDIGIKVTFIHAGKHKVDGNPYEPLPKEVKARIQSEIDSLYSIFVATVARNRGIDEDTIRGTEALTYGATESLSIGLADEIGSIEDSLVAFAAELNIQQGDKNMSTEKKDAATFDQATLDAARAEARAEGQKEGRIEGITAERSRIASIMKLDESTNRRDAAFNIAVTTDMSVEQTKTLLATLPESKAETAEAKSANSALFNSAMAASGNPELGSSEPAAEVSPVARILGDYKAVTGQK